MRARVEYSFRDKLYNETDLFVSDFNNIQNEFDEYIKKTYLENVPEEDQPTEFTIEEVHPKDASN